MLQLFVSIALDPLQQRTQRLLLLLSQQRFLLLQCFLHLKTDLIIVLLLLLLFALNLQEFSLLVPLHKRQFFYFVF
jgi:hypothetical protein